MNVETAGHAGTLQSKLLNTENIDMFRHPNYYKELRKRNKPAGTGGALCVDPEAGSDQAISESKTVDIGDSVRPDPGLKPQASSIKHQAPKASSDKHQAPSSKHQA